jgi:O-antigen ligase
VILASMAGAALLTGRIRLSGAPGRRLRIAAVTGIAAVTAVLVAVALSAETRPADLPQGATAGRLTSAESNRYAYWKVALRSWADHPLQGVGSGGFATEWRRERTIAESVRDAHSLYIETAAELGLVGLLLLAGLVAGAVGCAVRAGPEWSAATAALAAFGLHAGLDWDWEMPAVTLVAVVLLAAPALSGRCSRPPPPSPRGAGRPGA